MHLIFLPKSWRDGLSFAQPIAKGHRSCLSLQPLRGQYYRPRSATCAHAPVPINSADDLNFTRPKLKLSAEELQEVQQKILEQLR